MDKITTKYPISAKLKEHVAYYYFMRSDSPDSEMNFDYYPHYYSAFNLFSNSIVDLNDECFKIVHSPNVGTASVISCGRNVFRNTSVIGKYDIVGIIFKPLSIFHFFDVFSQNPFRNPEYLVNASDFGALGNFTQDVFQEEEIDSKVAMIENVLLENQRTFHMPILQAAVDAIIKSQGSIRVKEIETKYNVKRRTLLRWFQKYLFCTISDFKNIVRLRTAIDSYKSTKKLGYVSYESNFYDQSDFTSHFKSLTGELPKNLLKAVKNENSLFWKVNST